MGKQKRVLTRSCEENFIPAIEAIRDALKSESPVLLVGIDGMCASGKTTLGDYLQELFDCNLFHMDDFFLQKHQRTPERLALTGGNVDYERFWEEVINPLMRKEKILYRPYHCGSGMIRTERVIPFKRLNIIEGSYSLHPYFGAVYGIRIFVEISEALQLERIRARNGEVILERFRSEWIPKENNYFAKYGIREGSLLIDNTMRENNHEEDQDGE